MMAKPIFQQALLQFSVSHDPSEIILICWFDAREPFLIIITAKYLCGKRDTFFAVFFDGIKLNRTAFIWNKCFVLINLNSHFWSCILAE